MKIIEIDENNIQDFKSILNNPDNKIFILIYADWCGHCRELLPIWKIIQQEKNNSDNDNIIIASLESDYLDNFKDKLPSIDGFPTIYYIHKNIPEKYEGERNKEKLLNFINTKSNNVNNNNNNYTYKKISGGKNKNNNKTKNITRKLYKKSNSSMKSKKSKSSKKSKLSKKSKSSKKSKKSKSSKKK